MSVGSDLSALPLARKLALVGGVGLFIVLFLPWVGVDFGDLGDLVDLDNFTDNGWDGVGVLAGVFAIAIVAWELVRLFGQDPKMSVSADYVTAGLAALTALFGLIQFLRAVTYGGDFEEDFEALGIDGPDAGPRFGAFLGLLFVLVLAYVAYLLFRSGSRQPVAPDAEGGAAGASESPWPPAGSAAGGVAGADGAAAGAAADGNPGDVAAADTTTSAPDTLDDASSTSADTVDTAASSAAETLGEPAADPLTEVASTEPAAASDATTHLDAVTDEPDTPDTPPTGR